MEDRAQSLRRNLISGSVVQITTGTEQHIGKVVEITDHFLKLKTTSSNQRADILIAIEEVKIVKTISQTRNEKTSGFVSPSYQTERTNISSHMQGRKVSQNFIKADAQSQKHHQPSYAHPDLTIEQLFREAQDKFNRNNDHSNAIRLIRQVLSRDAEYPGAKAFLEQCLEIARRKNTRSKLAPNGDTQQTEANQSIESGEAHIPGRSKYFVLALQTTSDEEAIHNLYRSIECKEPKSSSAVKDLANRLAALDRGQEAIDVLIKHRAIVRDQKTVDNLLAHIYIKLKRYDEALELLEKKAATDPPAKKSIETIKKIADCYIRLKKYTNAIIHLTAILELQKDITVDNRPTLKRLAFCHMQEQQYNNAEKLLRGILEMSPDDEQALELLEALHKGRKTGQVDEHIANKVFLDAQNEIDNFSHFFLKRCEFRGVPPTRLQEKIHEKKFVPSDIDRLEKLITGAMYAHNYSDCAEFYISAANIVYIQGWEDKSEVYKYLYRSFASRGDASLKSKSLDTVREWYCEALHNYDKVHQRDRVEKEAIRIIVRFLSLASGEDAVSLQHTPLSIEHVLNAILDQSQQTDLFAHVAYLTAQSKQARQIILPCIFAQPRFREMAFTYLASKLDLSIQPQEYSSSRLLELWSALDKKNRINRKWIYDDLRLIAEFELKQSFAEKIENDVKRINDVKEHLFFQLDRDRLTELSIILGLVLRIFKETSFEQREYLCEKIGEQCRRLLEQIISEPTRVSVECLYDIVETIQRGAKETLEQIYATSEPQITLNQAHYNYTPDAHKRIVVQIDIMNGRYCSPAESVELKVLGATNTVFEIEKQKMLLEPDPSLQGGDEGKFFIHIHVTDEALRQGAFSLPVSITYRTRSGATPSYEKAFHIELHEEHFKEIEPNPYAPHVKGTPVEDPKMFFGRGEFIEKVARTIAYAESRAIVIYGQKRAGKSSILHHLKNRLEKESHLLVVDVGSVTTISLDTRTSFMNQILWQILFAIKKALLDRDKEGQEILSQISFPARSANFFDHPASLMYFHEIIDNFRDTTRKMPGWKNVRIVLLIDEFQYIYELMRKNRLEESFMKHWKALLERNLFNVVLVGQNVMTKFKEEYPNEFDAMQEEPVSYLEDKDAKDLICNPIRLEGENGEDRYDRSAIKRILNLTAGSPYYIQIFCYHLVEYMNREGIKYVTEAIVEEVKYSLLKGKNARFTNENDFDNLISSGDTSEDETYRKDAVQIMACIAKKSLASPCPRKDIDCQLEPERVNTILDDYVKRGVLQRDRGEHGQNYSLYVGLFQQWLNLHK